MYRFLQRTFLAVAVIVIVNSSVFAQDADKAETNGEVDAIKTLIDRYVESIDSADSSVGAELFFQTDTISFINPKGHVSGWDGVKKGIYGMFANTFSKRELKVDKLDIQVYDETAVAVFYWTFDATFREYGESIQTRGRETQVLKTIDGTWKILHVHYSNMPTKEEREGF